MKCLVCDKEYEDELEPSIAYANAYFFRCCDLLHYKRTDINDFSFFRFFEKPDKVFSLKEMQKLIKLKAFW